MSAIRDGRYPIMLDKERHLLYDLNAIDAIQDRFGDLSKIGEAMSGKDGLKNLRFLLTVLLNEGEDDQTCALTEREVGRLIHVGNLAEVKGAIFAAISVGNAGKPEPDGSDDEVDEKNAKTSMIEE